MSGCACDCESAMWMAAMGAPISQRQSRLETSWLPTTEAYFIALICKLTVEAIKAPVSSRQSCEFHEKKSMQEQEHKHIMSCPAQKLSPFDIREVDEGRRNTEAIRPLFGYTPTPVKGTMSSTVSLALSGSFVGAPSTRSSNVKSSEWVAFRPKTTRRAIAHPGVVTISARVINKENNGNSSQESAKTKVVVKVPHRITKRRVILISGPTAVGKTSLSIELAKAVGGEIVNADSVQVYKGLDIGAAKATVEERQGIPHHVMDLVLPTEDYTPENFVVDARAATEDILSRGLVPIVIGGTGLYMRSFMHNRVGITSHLFEGECGREDEQCDADWDWDYDFQAYYLYQHRADRFPRVDFRCESMIPDLLDETAWLLSLGVRPRTNLASGAIGYEEAMDLLLEAREQEGEITEERFLEFVRLFMHNSKGLVKKQIAWFRKDERSDVRKFRWIQAGLPVDQMVDALVDEYRRPVWKASELPSGQHLKAASLKEQKRLKEYKPTITIYSDAELRARALQKIKLGFGLA